MILVEMRIRMNKSELNENDDDNKEKQSLSSGTEMMNDNESSVKL